MGGVLLISTPLHDGVGVADDPIDTDAHIWALPLHATVPSMTMSPCTQILALLLHGLLPVPLWIMPLEPSARSVGPPEAVLEELAEPPLGEPSTLKL